MLPEFFARHIRVRAYYLSLERREMGKPADPLADWGQAVTEFGLAPLDDLLMRVSRFISRHGGVMLPFRVVYDVVSDLFRIPVQFGPLLA